MPGFIQEFELVVGHLAVQIMETRQFDGLCRGVSQLAADAVAIGSHALQTHFGGAPCEISPQLQSIPVLPCDFVGDTLLLPGSGTVDTTGQIGLAVFKTVEIIHGDLNFPFRSDAGLHPGWVRRG